MSKLGKVYIELASYCSNIQYAHIVQLVIAGYIAVQSSAGEMLVVSMFSELAERTFHRNTLGSKMIFNKLLSLICKQIFSLLQIEKVGK